MANALRTGIRATAMYPDWTPAEDARLRDAYARGERIDLVADELGRSHRGARSRAFKIGLAGTHPSHGGWCTERPWSEQEDAKLRDGYGKIDTVELAASIGRPKGAIYQRAFALGLKNGFFREYSEQDLTALRIAHARGIAIGDLAAAMGVTIVRLSPYATRHGYRFGRRPLLVDPITIEQIIQLEDADLPLPAVKVRAVPSRTPRPPKAAKAPKPPRPAKTLRAPKPAGAPKALRPARIAKPSPPSLSPARATKTAIMPAPCDPVVLAPRIDVAVYVKPADIQPRRPRPIYGIGWAERLAARVQSAKAFLQEKGFSVSRSTAYEGKWLVSGYKQPGTNEDLFALARQFGWEDA